MRTLHIFQNGLSIAVRQDFRAYLSRFVTDTVTTITLPYLSHSRTDQIIILETLLETYVKNMKTYILKHNVVQTPRVHTPIPSDLPPFTAIITTYHKAIHTENLHAYVCSPNFFYFFYLFFIYFFFTPWPKGCHPHCTPYSGSTIPSRCSAFDIVS